jgi:hypothetical protein
MNPDAAKASRMLALVFASFFFVAGSATAHAAVLPESRIAAALASAKNVQRRPSPSTTLSFPYYAIEGTDVQGYLDEDLLDYGYLANGEDVLIVPLESGGSGGVFDTLLFTSLGSAPRFVGYLPSASGHLDVHIAQGRLIARTPVYRTNDPNCCPSAHHVTSYTLENGQLKKVEEHEET